MSIKTVDINVNDTLDLRVRKINTNFRQLSKSKNTPTTIQQSKDIDESLIVHTYDEMTAAYAATILTI